MTTDGGQMAGRSRAGQHPWRGYMRRMAAGLAAFAVATGSVVWTVPGADASQAQSTRQITFSGFQTLPDGTGRVVVHLTARPEFHVSSDGAQVTVRLPETSVGVRNNRNPLDVSQFNVLLLRAQLVPRGSDVDLVLKLRKPAELQVAIVESPEDGVSLHVVIPAS